MRRYIVLLLISGIVWAKTEFDKLVLKDGTTFFGEYSKIEEEIVYFKPQDTFVFEPVSVKQIQTLKLRGGQIIIVGGISGVKARSQIVGFVFIVGIIYYIYKISKEQFKGGFGSSYDNCGAGCGGTVDLP